ncbi:MAG: hypothetical protein LBG59_00460 [Candidatus Peribacteria bacterium]|jgi:20S proteasome alpha/beta subunit|nr:hypothetical protein [Candidatus Peribacteria bacterium]
MHKLNDLVDGVKRGTSAAGRGASGAADIITEAMEEVVKKHTLTRTLDAELQALMRDKGILTDNNLIQKVTKEMDYIEEMKGQLKTLKNVDELDALHMLWTQVKQFKKQP